MNAPLLSVIVPFHNRREVIAECLRSLYASTYQNIEVIAVDDGSTDGSAAVVGEFPARLVTLGENRGAGPCRNEGARVARGEILVFVDSDVLVGPEALGLIVEDFAGEAGVAAVQAIYSAACRYPNFVSRYANAHYHAYGMQNAKRFIGSVGTYCVAVKRDVFLAVGGFDEQKGTAKLAGEDQFFGYKFDRDTQRILLDQRIQVEHLKHYALGAYLAHDMQTGSHQVQRVLRGNVREMIGRLAGGEVGTLIPASLVYSTVLAWTILAAAILGVWVKSWALAVVVAAGVTAFYAMNGRFLAYTLKTYGAWFCARSAALTFVRMVCAGLGGIQGAARGLRMWRG